MLRTAVNLQRVHIALSWGWVSGQLRYSVVEESKPKTIVGNVAQDLGVKRSDISYRRLHLEAEKINYFALNRETGALIVKDRIDRESLCGLTASCLMHLEVVAENPLELYNVEIEIVDINDHSPIFSSNYRNLKISEVFTGPGAQFALESAEDSDVGVNGVSQYTLNTNPYFSLSVKNHKGTPPLEGNCLVHVDVEDVNDNAPDISLTTITNTIPENAPLATAVVFINVKDKDSGKNGEIKLSISPNVPFKIKQVKNCYALVTDGNLDREETSQYTIELTASDLGSPPLYSKTSVSLRVSDINDNAPVFTQSTYNAFIKENSDPGTLLCTVSATDLDEGVNSDLIYSIVESQIEGSSVSSFVYIHSNDGNIYAQRSFDYEQIQVLQITIKVEDSGSPQLSSTVPVFIFILDTNDNPPSLLYPEHAEDLIVQERIPKSASAGYLVTKLSAVDLDSGHNAWLVFTLIDPINYSSFLVSKLTGEVRTVRGLQETENMEQQLVISISDQGTPPLSTTVTVLLSIADEVILERPKSGDFLTNSKPPSDMTLYLIISLVAISLVSLVTFMILLVKCLRKDSYDYSNSCILGGSQSKSYTDQYQPALYLNTDGTLKYMEVRMVPPGCQGQSYQTNLPPASEQQDFNFLRPQDFLQLNMANPADSSSELNSENAAGKVELIGESLCDFKPSCLLYLEVVAENPVETFSLEVEVLDINDNSPIFSASNQSIKITEVFAGPGARFALEIAEDSDVGVNGVSQYTLNTNPYFSLSVKNRKDGTLIPQLILEKVLDREEKQEHHLILTAIDGGEPARSGTCRITIIVLDINDNPPVFNQSVYKISIQENLPLNTVILTLNATDQDDGANGEIQFSFDGHTSKSARQLFGLDTHTGDIFITELVDYEELNFYELSIRAVDNGNPELEGSCIVQVEIEDVNDNSPYITFSSTLYNIQENAPLESIIGFIIVKDEDSGKNGEIKLSISPNVPFKIKQINNRYALITKRILDREETSQYMIELTASDLGSPPLYSKTSVTLGVSDINDNAPVFTQSAYNAFIKENSDPGTLLCTVSATDLDEGVNSDLVYSIVESQIDGSSVSSFVYIHSNDGNIYAQRSFDYEQIQVLQITIKVEDSGSPQLSSTVPVFIFILDTNDNPPSLLYPEHSEDLIVQERIPKSASAGYLVTKLSAVDLDSGHNAWLMFTLIDPISYSSFQVSKLTGEVRTVRGLQETENMEQQLVISISDQGTPPLSTTVTVLISIADEVIVERPKSGDFLTNSKPPSDMTLYLIISLVAISLVSLVTFMILLVKCLRKDSYDYSSSCCILGGSQSKSYTDQYQPALYLNTDGTLKYMEVRMVPPGSQRQSHQTNFQPAPEQQDFNCMRPVDFTQTQHLVKDIITEENSPNNSKVQKAWLLNL
ncbi:unnamed protein product [Ranitomeya imitator]|uniref:Cadherin domain-containing protein n=1 Tax=Ranitomeya imitator TaxID=111125 RepID=A0ABN9M8X5_9NEOB|nr:unnamed protein product [Ranitomeya imitator]